MSIHLHRAVRDNFIEKVSAVARTIPTMTVIDAGSFVAVDCGLPSDTFNVIVPRSLAGTDRLLQDGVGHFMARRWPAALWYWEDAADQAGVAALTGYGLVHSETHSAMVADLQQVELAARLPDELTIQRVSRADDVHRYGAVISRLFGGSDEARQVMAYYQLLGQYSPASVPAQQLYLGLYRGAAVATGCLFVAGETVGIYDIVTDADYRQRGIGSAMFAYLLQQARALGQRYAVLQASADGQGIYARAGFDMVGLVHTFENRPLL